MDTAPSRSWSTKPKGLKCSSFSVTRGIDVEIIQNYRCVFVFVFVWPTGWRGPPTQRLCTKRTSAHSNSKGWGPSKNATRCCRCSPSLLQRGHIFAVVYWGSVVKVKDANRLDRLIREAGPVVVALCWSPWRRWRSREPPPPPSNTASNTPTPLLPGEIQAHWDHKSTKLQIICFNDRTCGVFFPIRTFGVTN